LSLPWFLDNYNSSSFGEPLDALGLSSPSSSSSYLENSLRSSLALETESDIAFTDAAADVAVASVTLLMPNNSKTTIFFIYIFTLL
jgi:hypothetical protein